jgi:hypothetical protein
MIENLGKLRLYQRVADNIDLILDPYQIQRKKGEKRKNNSISPLKKSDSGN